jgi:NADH-quinone oxidoreductase subunit M
MNLLLATLTLPLAGFFLLLLLPLGAKAASVLARFIAALTLVVSLGLVPATQSAPVAFTSVVDIPWIDNFGIHFHLGVDGISLWLIVLTTLLVLVGVWIAEKLIKDRVRTFLALVLLFEFGLLGVFSALDLFVFYVFWEVALVPMYLMVGIWGGPRRTYAAVKFFVFTFAGSVIMLAAIIYIYTRAQTFDYAQIMGALSSGRLIFSHTEQLFLFLGFFVAFAIKIPLFPLHTWQPLTYVQAPTTATFLIAAGMSKMGTYGLVRFALPLFGGGAHRCAPWIIVLAIISIVYGALIAIVQPNLKQLVAYSSISHLGFVVLGLFTFEQIGIDGAVYQMVAHGVSTGALFVLIAYLENRHGSTDIASFGGLATPAPGLATAFMLATLASVGLPLLSNFIGEFLVLQGAAIANFPYAVWAASGTVFSAVYLLWMYQRTFFGSPSAANAAFPDLSLAEWAPLVLLLVPIVWLGTYAQTFLPAISAANAAWLEQSRSNADVRADKRSPLLLPLATASVPLRKVN